jgi:integrase/recombinase XerC
LRADGYADTTVKAYQNAVRSLAGWLAEHHPEVGPAGLDRQHIRGWLVEVRERHSSNTARGWFGRGAALLPLAAGRGRGRP